MRGGQPPFNLPFSGENVGTVLRTLHSYCKLALSGGNPRFRLPSQLKHLQVKRVKGSLAAGEIFDG